MIPSIDDPTVSFVTMTNGALIQDIEKSIGTFYLLFSQTKLQLYVLLGKIHKPFAPCSLAHFKN